MMLMLRSVLARPDDGGSGHLLKTR